MGPPREWGAEACRAQSPMGTRNKEVITSFAEGDTRAQLRPPWLKQVRLSRGVSAFSKAPRPTTAVSCYTATHYKNTSAGNPQRETKDQTEMGDGYRTIREQGVASALFPGNQSPQFSPGPPCVPRYQRAQKERQEVEG